MNKLEAIKKGEKINIPCPFNKKYRCTLKVPGGACLNCKHYKRSVNGPGAA